MRNRPGCAAVGFPRGEPPDDYSALTTCTAEEAIELLAQSQPDLMLLDVVLRYLFMLASRLVPSEATCDHYG